MIKNKTIFRNFIWNTIGSTLASFNSLFFLIAITRINGLDDAGIFSITVTTAYILYIFAIYSGRNCQVTDIKGEIKDKDYIVSRMITCIGMLIITVEFMILSKYDQYKSTILFCLCLWKALEAFGDVFYGVLQKNEKLHLVGKSLVIKSIVGILLFVAVDYFTNNLIYACISLPIVSLLTILCYDLPKAIPFIKKQEKAILENVWKIYKSEFFLFAGSFLTMYILNAPKYAIENYLTNDIQAIYGIILMPASVLSLFAQFIIAPAMNDLTKLYKENNLKQMKKIENKLIYMIIGFGILAIVLGYFLGIPVLNLIYHVDLTGYTMVLIAILFSYILYAMGFIKTIILTIYRKIKEQFWIYFVTAIVALIASNYLIQTLGQKGIVLSYFVIMLTYYLLFCLLTRYQYYKKNRK